MRTLATLFFVATTSFAFHPTARAVNPPPDGGYPNRNTAEGTDALFSLNIDLGLDNTALGYDALYLNTNGYGNTGAGSYALYSNNGIYNTGLGFDALYNNTSGGYNTACGTGALFNNNTGHDNTAVGFNALNQSTSGSTNIALGSGALYNNTTGGGNIAVGYAALANSKTPNNNIAIGILAEDANSTGGSNVAIGSNALYSNSTGGINTVIGDSAGFGIKGDRNIAVGASAGKNLTTGSYNLDIGNAGVAGESGTIRLGTAGHHVAAYMAGISGATVASGVGVIVSTDGHLGTVNSSARYKERIQPMDKRSEEILALQPVTFRYKKELDPDKIPQFGLIAEQVERVDPDLVARDEQGKAYSVRYDAVNAMLLNEFLKEHHRVQELEGQVAELAAGLQKVNAQLALRQEATLVVASHP